MFRLAIFFAVFCAVGALASIHADDDHPGPAVQRSVRRFLQTLHYDRSAEFIAALFDLDGDGTPEAIVHVMSRIDCGSGGCSTLILSRRGGKWRIVTDIGLTHPPMRVLKTRSNGWHDLGVWVQGGGILPGYEAQLRFNGRSYPENPTIPPASALTRKVAGNVIVASTQKPEPLYPPR